MLLRASPVHISSTSDLSSSHLIFPSPQLQLLSEPNRTFSRSLIEYLKRKKMPALRKRCFSNATLHNTAAPTNACTGNSGALPDVVECHFRYCTFQE